MVADGLEAVGVLFGTEAEEAVGNRNSASAFGTEDEIGFGASIIAGAPDGREPELNTR